ncbi:hypothetical protein [Emticicia sp. BO119]|uniref:hypothetical protein n=1 Tax=Emticicia sp. BO119 TaxID=2757768 RepID=UPI0015F0FDF9|nr:hypothetical protein [Emticicia sp. BO119]MBA4849476.1 hypothetical protein [Emticicia sp. BO119]
MNQSNHPTKEIAENVSNCLKAITIADAANDRIGGVSITSKQKALISAISVSLNSDENQISEQLILRKILEALAIGALIPASSLSRSLSAINNYLPVQAFDPNQYVERAVYDELRSEYDQIYADAGSDNIVIMSREEYEELGLSEEQIGEIVNIAQQYEYPTAVQIVKQYLSDEENDEDVSSGY